ncbi:MAG TPA: 6-pyruvoyl-tetrahydropterin synthase-related protein [Anaerolineales bacterium]|mgnify:CR=1 FL=1|jgi:hypothetical protein|nr:6-pyruvoyl-tetrahydropterin synthase-related protein [Anaerolineales bacterium]HQX18170.1 6-pyruvoyl-tetrahydropterin synthase-related protein [Anaerolineales bacterium]
MNKRALSSDDVGILLLLVSIILGGWFRIFPPLQAGFPINDGGLFYSMIEALQNNGFRIPQFVEYNGLEIPFVYPPLGFYVAATVSTVLDVDIFTTLRWIPAIVLIGTIPAVYTLAKALLNSKLEAGLAALIYALLPRSIMWLIMGGGITRSFGQLFLILAALNLHKMYTTGERKSTIGSVIFCSLVVVTHPEATIHTIGIALTFAILYARNRRGLIQTALVGAGTLLIASPWWAAMLIRHGITPFLSASQSGFHDFAYFYAFFIAYTQETFIPLIAVFAWVGILYLLSKREFTLPILFALPFLIEPRNAPNVGILIIPMLAARAVIRVLLPSFKGSQITVENDNPALLLSATSQKFFAAILAFCLIVGMQIFDSELSENRVRPETQLTYAWIKNHTPPESRFVLLSGNVKPLEDFNNEWFPVLTGRVSLTTLQGLEWDEDIDFTEHSMWLSDVQMCRFDFETLACLRNLGLGSKEKFDYLIVFRETLEPPLYLAGIPSWATNEGRSVVYESNEILIVEFP